jgi:hypothetical protein
LLNPFWRRHQKTLALVIAGIASAGQARSFAVATCMKNWLGVRLDSAVNRFYRLLRNSRIDYTEFASSWAQMLSKRHGGHLVVSIDWTEWHHGLRMLTAAVVTGKRAIPLFAQATKKLVRTRSQNSYENTFLRLLADAIKRAGTTATMLCDRGFRRVSWIALLQKLDLGFVVRLKADVTVNYKGHKQLLEQLAGSLPRGRVVDLGIVPLRSDAAINVRVVFYWAKKAKEPWWLAVSNDIKGARAIKLYDRRMTVEEQFRDTKGKRFGVKLYWTQFRDPEALARFVMLLAVALLIWIIAGARQAHRDPSLRLVSKKKGPRQSFVTIGIRLITSDPAQLVLTVAMLRRWLEPPAERSLGKHGIGAAK